MAGSYTSDTHAQTDFEERISSDLRNCSVKEYKTAGGTKIIKVRLAAKLKREGKASIPSYLLLPKIHSPTKIQTQTGQIHPPRGFEGRTVHLYFTSCAPAQTFSHQWCSHADSFKPIFCDT